MSKFLRNAYVAAAVFAVAAVLTAGAGFLAGRATAGQGGTAYYQSAAPGTPTLVRSEAGIPVGVPGSFRDVVGRVMPSVVEIDVVDVVKQRAPQTPFDFFFGPQNGQGQERQYQMQGLGSGVIVRESGRTVYVLTNNHVAGDATQIKVKLTDGREFTGKLVGKDPRRDLALVSFQTNEKVPVATLGDSGSVRPGDWVLAIGNPLGFQSTVTAGIVSAVGRQSSPGSGVAGFTDYIQTDAAINQGNSGGPLINTDGEVIGIDTWIASPSGGSVGLGFAIPINQAKSVIGDFITKGGVEYGWLGATVGNAPAEVLKSLGVADGTNGAMIMDLFKGSPADKAGLEPGDIVTAIGDHKVSNSSDLVQIVGNMAPGASARFQVVREGAAHSYNVVLSKRADDATLAKMSDKLWPGFIAVVQDGKVIVASVDQNSPASQGLQQGDVLLKVDGDRVGSLKDFYHRLNVKSGKQVLFTVERDGSQVIFGLPR
jgi:Do/DeqQ family serine protease